MVVAAVLIRVLLRPEPATLIISTATKGGTYGVFGQQLGRIVEDLSEQLVERVDVLPSGGSTENLDRLLAGEADVAFTTRNAIDGYTREQREKLRVLARLYSDTLQLVVPDDGARTAPGALRGKRIALGPIGSGTRITAERVLQAMQFSERDYTSVEGGSFDETADALLEGEVDAAFFAAGTPTAAVRKLLQSGEWRLQSLNNMDVEVPGYARETIPAFSYENQTEVVETWGTDVFLVCRRELDDELAFAIVKGMFENLRELLDVHPTAQHIKLANAFDAEKLPAWTSLHPGATGFVKWSDETLLIATGAISGKYYELGRMIHRLLEIRGIESFVIHSDGSIENAAILASGRPALAIMQYDTALASRAGVSFYDFDAAEEVDIPAIPEVRGLRLLVALHEDRVHVFARRAALNNIEALLDSTQPLSLADLRSHLASDDPLKVWLGPARSGSRLLSQAILHHHGIHMSEVSPQFMSDADMLTRYYSGEIDLGFFASHVPSHVLSPLVDDTNTVLLSMEPKARIGLLGPALTAATIEPGTYACQPEGSPEIQTLSTRALLVTTETVAADVEAITEAIFDGEAFLGIPGGRAAMAQFIPSLPLHPSAEAYYRRTGHLPSRPTLATRLFDWLSVTWRFFAILVIIVAGSRGGIELKREIAANDVYKKVLSRFVSTSDVEKVGQLLTLRKDINERVVRNWWDEGKLDRGRWRQLHDLINEFLSDEKENWGRTLLVEARTILNDPELDGQTRRKRLDALEKRVWQSVETGALDASHHAMLRSAFAEAPPSPNARDGWSV